LLKNCAKYSRGSGTGSKTRAVIQTFPKKAPGTGTAMNHYGSITLVEFRSLTKYAGNFKLEPYVKKEFCIFFGNDLSTSASEGMN
jgi:hypothetical protein